jgi:predicted HicB family RNase H-like nuclease
MGEKKKKTFEIDTELEQLIKIQAAIENVSINDWVNSVLWKAIPKDTKEIVRD